MIYKFGSWILQVKKYTNSKFQTLNPKQIQMTKIQKFKTLCFEFLSFGFWICLEFRI